MKRILAAAFALCLAALLPARGAEVTRIMVGFPPGQATDLIARVIADKLGPALGETVIVENRPGQGGSIVLADLTRAPPDGHTMVIPALAALSVNPHLYKSVGYDTLTDFAAVALVCDLPMLLVVNPSLPVKSVPDLIAYAKANPDKLVNPSSGIGTLSHLGMEDFKRRAGINILHVPYKGSAPAMTDLMAGVVNVAMDTVAVTQPFIEAGKMRLIASAFSKRVAAFPGTPTIAEQGFPGFSVAAWLGIVVPAATPKDRVNRLGAAITQIVQSPDVEQKFAALGTIPHPMNPGEFDKFMRSEYARWGAVVEASGVKTQ
jgi:tripartite-type tricarboxylate transporter receptor subunit TctC